MNREEFLEAVKKSLKVPEARKTTAVNYVMFVVDNGKALKDGGFSLHICNGKAMGNHSNKEDSSPLVFSFKNADVAKKSIDSFHVRAGGSFETKNGRVFLRCYDYDGPDRTAFYSLFNGLESFSLESSENGAHAFLFTNQEPPAPFSVDFSGGKIEVKNGGYLRSFPSSSTDFIKGKTFPELLKETFNGSLPAISAEALPDILKRPPQTKEKGLFSMTEPQTKEKDFGLIDRAKNSPFLVTDIKRALVDAGFLSMGEKDGRQQYRHKEKRDKSPSLSLDEKSGLLFLYGNSTKALFNYPPNDTIDALDAGAILNNMEKLDFIKELADSNQSARPLSLSLCLRSKDKETKEAEALSKTEPQTKKKSAQNAFPAEVLAYFEKGDRPLSIIYNWLTLRAPRPTLAPFRVFTSLSILSALTMRKIWIGNKYASPIWVIGIGEPECGKSTVLEAAEAFLSAYYYSGNEKDNITEIPTDFPASAQAFYKRLLENDRRAVFVHDELKNFLEQDPGRESSFVAPLLKTYGGGNVTYPDSMTERRSGAKNPVLKDCFTDILGAVQTSYMPALFKKDFLTRGILRRFTVCAIDTVEDDPSEDFKRPANKEKGALSFSIVPKSDIIKTIANMKEQTNFYITKEQGALYYYKLVKLNEKLKEYNRSLSIKDQLKSLFPLFALNDCKEFPADNIAEHLTDESGRAYYSLACWYIAEVKRLEKEAKRIERKEQLDAGKKAAYYKAAKDKGAAALSSCLSRAQLNQIERIRGVFLDLANNQKERIENNNIVLRSTELYTIIGKKYRVGGEKWNDIVTRFNIHKLGKKYYVPIQDL